MSPFPDESDESDEPRRSALRIVGRRVPPPVTFSASAQLLAQGARFNDEIHRLPGGQRTLIAKGVYRFRSFEQANRHDLECIVASVVQTARERS